MRLAPKLTTLFLGLSLTPLAVVGGLAFVSVRHGIETQAFTHLRSVALHKEAQFTRWVEDSQRHVESLAQRPLVRSLASALVEASAGAPEANAAGQRLLDDHLEPSLHFARDFADLFLLRVPDGLRIVSTDPRLVGVYRENAPYFVRGRAAPFVQTFYHSFTLERPTMVVSGPVRDAGGRAVAVLAGHLDLGELSRIMSMGEDMTRSEETYVVSRFNVKATTSRLDGSAGYRNVRSQGVQACLAGRNGTGRYADYRGVEVLGAHRWLPSLGVCVISEVDRAEVLSSVRDLEWSIAAGGLLVTLVVIAIAAYAARRITRPLRRLAEGAAVVGRGGLDVRIGESAADELGQAARAFDTMAADLARVTASRDELDREVASRRLAEDALRRGNARLTRTLEALRDAQTRVAQSEKLAALGTMAAGVAHELNNPTMGVMNYVEFARERVEDPRVREVLQRAGASAERIRDIVRNVLHFAHPGQGEPERVDVHALLDRVLGLMSADLRHAGIEVHTTVDGAPAFAWIDPSGLQQVLVNLLTNARDATLEIGPGEIRVDIAGGPDHVRIAVRDPGPGIAPDRLERIFDPFFTTKPPGEGTGLGLSLARSTVQDAGGTLGVEGRPDRGACFVVVLPARAGVAGAPERAPEAID